MNTNIICPSCFTETNIYESICSNCQQDLDPLKPLFSLSFQLYNQSIYYNNNDQINEAFESINSAISVFPYSRDVLRYALLLGLTHGYYEFSKRILNLAEKFNLNNLSLEYNEELEHRTEKWNHILQDPKQLVNINNNELNFRERLLLSKTQVSKQTESLESELSLNNGNGNDSIQRKVKQRYGKALLAGVVSITVLMSVTFYYSHADNTRQRDIAKSNMSMKSVESYKEYLFQMQSNEYPKILSGIKNLESETGNKVNLSTLKDLLAEQIYNEGLQSYRNNDFQESYKLLDDILEYKVKNEDKKLYYLGMSAVNTGRDTTAIQAFKKLLNRTDIDSGYEVEAVFRLSKLLDGAEARKYAFIIKEKYSRTIYYNSFIKGLIGNGN